MILNTKFIIFMALTTRVDGHCSHRRGDSTRGDRGYQASGVESDRMKTHRLIKHTVDFNTVKHTVGMSCAHPMMQQ